MFLLVPAYPGCPGSKAVKRSESLTVFGNMGKIGCQSALYLRESFCLEGTANVIGIDKLAATCDRKAFGI